MKVISIKQQIPTIPHHSFFRDKQSKTIAQIHNRLKNNLKFISTYNRSYSQMFNDEELLYTVSQKNVSLNKMEYIISNILKNDSVYVTDIELKQDAKKHSSVFFRFDRHFDIRFRITNQNFIICDIKKDNCSDNEIFVFTKQSFFRKHKTIKNFLHSEFPEYFADKDNLYKEINKYILGKIHISNCQETSLMIEKRTFIKNCINKILLNKNHVDKDNINEFDKDILDMDNMKNYQYKYHFKEAVLFLYNIFILENKTTKKDILISHIKYRRKAKKSNLLSGHEIIDYAHNVFNKNDILTSYPVSREEYKELLVNI